MLMRPSATTALLVPAVTLVGLLLVRALKAETSDPNKPIPNPQHDPTNVDVLRHQLEDLLAQAAANPLSVDPDAMEQLAVQLDESGLHEEAARLRLAETIARGAQGAHATPPPPGTFTPAPGTMPTVLPAALQARFDYLMTPGNTTLAYRFEILAHEIEKLGFPTQVAQLRKRAAEIRAGNAAAAVVQPKHPMQRPR